MCVNHFEHLGKFKEYEKKNVIIYGAIGMFFFVALFNVYNYFQESRQAVLEQEAQRIAQVEKLKADAAEAERKAQLEHEVEMQNLALEKDRKEAELLDRKVKSQQRLEGYQLLKQARKSATQDRYLQRRIESARKHKYIPEGLSGKVTIGIKSATYLTIPNNPEDYSGNFKPSSILTADKLTSTAISWTAIVKLLILLALRMSVRLIRRGLESRSR